MASRKQEPFSVTFDEVNALVASYLQESDVDRHAAGAAISKVMQERMRRTRIRLPTPKRSEG